MPPTAFKGTKNRPERLPGCSCIRSLITLPLQLLCRSDAKVNFPAAFNKAWRHGQTAQETNARKEGKRFHFPWTCLQLTKVTKDIVLEEKKCPTFTSFVDAQRKTGINISESQKTAISALVRFSSFWSGPFSSLPASLCNITLSHYL